jgi:DNA-binding NarL/FixJ family response regulator
MSATSGMSPDIITVLVADSNQTQSQLLSGALRRQGTFKVAVCEAQLSECLSLLEGDPADVVLLADGLTDNRQQLYELIRGLHSAHPHMAIVLLLDDYDRELVVNSLRAGARGLFCLASLPFKALCRCIMSVHQGQYWTNTEQMRFLIDALSVAPTARLINSRGQVVLTAREEQTVNLVAEGLNNREIAQQLSVKENTVKKSLLRIYDKVGVSNRVELVLYAISHREERVAKIEAVRETVTL